MMKNIHEIVQVVLKNLERKGLLPIPSNFEKEFFSVASKTDILLEDVVELEEIMTSLTPSEKEHFQIQNISSFKEIAQILSHRVS